MVEITGEDTIEMNIQELTAVSTTIVGMLFFGGAVLIALGMVTVHGMNDGFTYAVLALSVVLMVKGIWTLWKNDSGRPPVSP